MLKIKFSWYNLSKLFAIAVVSWVCCPWLGQNTGLICGFALAAGWCFCSFFCRERGFIVRTDTIYMIIFGLDLVLSLILTGRVFQTYEPYYFLSMICLFFLPFYMFCFYFDHEDKVFLKRLTLVGLLLTVVGSITSTYYAVANPLIMKTISQNLDTEFLAYRKAGIGSFGFIYMLMFSMIAIVGALKANLGENRRPLVLCVVLFLVMGIICIAISTFTTAMLLSILGILLVLIDNPKNKIINITKYVILVLIFLIFSQLIGNFLANIRTDYLSVTERLNEIGNILRGNSLGNNTEARLEYMVRSFECFFKYPLLGYNFQINPAYKVGTHCEWIDIFGVYGMIGGIPLLATIIYKLKAVSQRLKFKSNFPYYKIIILVFTIYGFLDPFLRLYHIGFALFLLVPGIAILYQNTGRAR